MGESDRRLEDKWNLLQMQGDKGQNFGGLGLQKNFEGCFTRIW